jgi:hypothetical protein
LELNAAAPARTVIALRLELNGAAEATLGVTAERRQSVGEAKAKKSKNSICLLFAPVPSCLGRFSTGAAPSFVARQAKPVILRASDKMLEGSQRSQPGRCRESAPVAAAFRGRRLFNGM